MVTTRGAQSGFHKCTTLTYTNVVTQYFRSTYSVQTEGQCELDIDLLSSVLKDLSDRANKYQKQVQIFVRVATNKFCQTNMFLVIV